LPADGSYVNDFQWRGTHDAVDPGVGLSPSSAFDQAEGKAEVAGSKRGPYGSYTPEVTRQRLLDCALELFGERGYDATSVQRIADRAGVTKGAFYHHFDSKDDVLRDIHHQYAQQMLDGARAIKASSGCTPIEQLRAIIKQAVIAFGTHRSHVAIFYQEFKSLSEESYDQIRVMHAEQERILRDIISKARKSGQLKSSVDPKLLVFAISGVTAWLYQWYQPSGPMSLAAIADGLADIILEGVVAD